MRNAVVRTLLLGGIGLALVVMVGALLWALVDARTDPSSTPEDSGGGSSEFARRSAAGKVVKRSRRAREPRTKVRVRIGTSSAVDAASPPQRTSATSDGASPLQRTRATSEAAHATPSAMFKIDGLAPAAVPRAIRQERDPRRRAAMLRQYRQSIARGRLAMLRRRRRLLEQTLQRGIQDPVSGRSIRQLDNQLSRIDKQIAQARAQLEELVAGEDLQSPTPPPATAGAREANGDTNP
jgi:hypothetical protein